MKIIITTLNNDKYYFVINSIMIDNNKDLIK